MYGICGYMANNAIENNTELFKMLRFNYSNKITDKSVYIKDKVALGIYTNTNKEMFPLTKTVLGNTYTIVFDGNISNIEDLKNELVNKGYLFEYYTDSEIVLTLYIHYKEKCVDFLDGVFSFAIFDECLNSLFVCRDRLGIKPLFYTKQNGIIAFASSIKSLLMLDNVKAIVSKDELCEIFGLGPAHTPGRTCFKDIFEIKPGFFGIFTPSSVTITNYWDLPTYKCLDDEKTVITNIQRLVTNSIKKEFQGHKKICTMLSGGLDSSIITAVANKNIKDLHTFSINFEGNDKDFNGSIYQPTKDSDFVKIMCDELKLNHTNIYFNEKDLFNSLKDAVIARDMPGMADIDSSMLVFCKQIATLGYDAALSGECSDEIFGGYPWYYKDELISSATFPWARSLNLRKNILNKDIISPESLENYVTKAYADTCKDIQYTSTDEFENMFRKTCYLTIKWFMNTLVERTARMSEMAGLEVKVPFADYKIFEYVYNISAKMKLGMTNKDAKLTEKYLLRKAFENTLPESIVYRKKSPFPKTYDPKYLELLENEVYNILNDESSPILLFIDKEFVTSLIKSHGKDLKENWFGQLMTYPQTLAYLIQVNMWFEIYKPEIRI